MDPRRQVYQFFNDGTDDGKFTITKVRPGNYTLHATADGVLGDFAQANITVEPGKTFDLGKLVWKPVRYGKQVWEIGYPDRAADEFFKGDGANYWLWGWNLRYALLFPNDLTYTVGKSDWHKDWFFEEVPHATNLSFVNPDAKDPANQRFGWVKAESLTQYPQTNQQRPLGASTAAASRPCGRSSSTCRRLEQGSRRLARGARRCRRPAQRPGGRGQRQASAGAIGDGSNPDNRAPHQTNAIRYNTDKGLWQQRTLKFDAALLKPGENDDDVHRAGGRSAERRGVGLSAPGTGRERQTGDRRSHHATAWPVKALRSIESGASSSWCPILDRQLHRRAGWGIERSSTALASLAPLCC